MLVFLLVFVLLLVLALVFVFRLLFVLLLMLVFLLVSPCWDRGAGLEPVHSWPRQLSTMYREAPRPLPGQGEELRSPHGGAGSKPDTLERAVAGGEASVTA